ncbi:alpha-hydroxy-acid oxidizing protein [Bradyrhizobium sp. 76]|nr:alpha-hydroxy-acid oxidizing protein [Bradyrhizobium sp. 76]
MNHSLNYGELRELTRCRLPHSSFEYIDRRTEDENGLRTNRHAFAVRIRPQLLTQSGGARTHSVSIFGQTSDVPIAPTAMAGLVWYRGEIELAKEHSSEELLRDLSQWAWITGCSHIRRFQRDYLEMPGRS